MARTTLEACMFCMSSPCQCNVVALKPRAVRPSVKATSKKEPVDSPTVPEVTITRRAGLQATPKVIVPESTADETREYREALTLLCTSGLICREDVEKNKADLLLTEVEVRALLWKLRKETV